MNFGLFLPDDGDGDDRPNRRESLSHGIKRDLIYENISKRNWRNTVFSFKISLFMAVFYGNKQFPLDHLTIMAWIWTWGCRWKWMVQVRMLPRISTRGWLEFFNAISIG